jgi:agmatinase
MTFDPNAAADKDAGIYGLPYTPDEARIVLLPVPWDATTSYGGGASEGPSAIYDASMQVDLFDVEIGYPYRGKVAMLPENGDIKTWNAEARRLAEEVIEAGGRVSGDAELEAALAKVNGSSARVNDVVYYETKRLLGQGKTVGVVGGDHSTPFGAIRAIAEAHPGLGILHVDAHADLRDAYEGFTDSHASIMFNVLRRVPNVAKIVQVGIRDLCEAEADLIAKDGRLSTLYDVHLAQARLQGKLLDVFAAKLSELPREVYVSFDVDGLDPALCPHTGTPVAGGLSFHEASMLLGMVAQSGRRIVGFDLNEVCPGPDDEWDANVGARVLYKLIGWTFVSQGVPEVKR